MKRVDDKINYDIRKQFTITEDQDYMLKEIQAYYHLTASDVFRMLIENEFKLLYFWEFQKGNEHPWAQ